MDKAMADDSTNVTDDSSMAWCIVLASVIFLGISVGCSILLINTLVLD